ncbi:MAG: toll/interleukin-1 receptor domain-containing protein [Anaerolineales bacterium]|nr:toll/interleukin-1 receptor domain-containing protein [Anaerolineales bacterium]
MAIFVSYSHANSDFTTQLASDLRAAGYDIWFDQFNLPAGSRQDYEIEKALHSCSVFLLVLSPESVHLQSVKDEIGYAINSAKPILWVLIAPCDIPFNLRSFQFVNFIDKPFEESLNELKDLLTQAGKTQSETDPVEKLPELKQEQKAVTSPIKTASIGGDQNIIQGNFSGGIITQGRNATVTAYQSNGMDAKELAALFDKLYQHVDARPTDPNVDKSELIEVIQKIEEESGKGKDANEKKLGRWVENLAQMAPDILDVVLASLGGPVSGITAVVKKIADRAQQQSKG